MNYVCENYEINKEEAEDRSAALAAYAGKIVLGSKEKEKKEETRKIDGFLEIGTGEEWNKWMLENRQGRINKAINQLILFEYDKDRPIRAWLKKKFRQDGKTEVKADGKQVHE